MLPRSQVPRRGSTDPASTSAPSSGRASPVPSAASSSASGPAVRGRRGSAHAPTAYQQALTTSASTYAPAFAPGSGSGSTSSPSAGLGGAALPTTAPTSSSTHNAPIPSSPGSASDSGGSAIEFSKNRTKDAGSTPGVPGPGTSASIASEVLGGNGPAPSRLGQVSPVIGAHGALPSTGTTTTAGALAGPSGPSAAPGVGTGTPQTGLGRMAAAARRLQAGVDGSPLAELSRPDDHPLSDKSLAERGYHTISTLNRLFHIPNRFSLMRPLGQGAYGLVVSVQDSLSGAGVAVKCITRVFDKVILARRALREITLLRHFGEHENLTGLIDLDYVWEGYNEIYLYMEPMEADLHQIVRSGQPLSNSHIQYFIYQLLRGMKYIHSANVIHRDLKPGNLLVNSDCELKICDFGLARGYRPVETPGEELKLTEYVATRWYRAPEIMLSNRGYTTAIDVWSIGCILAELLGGKPLFKGKDYVDQLNLILGILGTPDEDTLSRTGSEKACQYIRTLPFSPVQPFDAVLPSSSDAQAVDLLSALLTFDPAKRISVPTALTHPYMSTYHDPSDEPDCPELFEKWEEVEALTTIPELKEAITREIDEFRAQVRMAGEDDYWEDGDEEDDDMEVDEAMGDGEGEEDADVTLRGRRETIAAAAIVLSPEGEMGQLPPRPPYPQSGTQASPEVGISPKNTTDAQVASTTSSSPEMDPSALSRAGLSPQSAQIGLGIGHSPAQSFRALSEGASALASSSSSATVPGVSGPYAPAARISTSPIASSSRIHALGGPATPGPASAVSVNASEDSFSASHTQPSSGRSSRRSSGLSMTRRPASFLFGGGMTPLQALSRINLPGNTGPGSGRASRDEPGGGGGAGAISPERETHPLRSSSLVGRRSRAPSGVMGAGEEMSLRPLIRKLSSVGLSNMMHPPGQGVDPYPDLDAAGGAAPARGGEAGEGRPAGAEGGGGLGLDTQGLGHQTYGQELAGIEIPPMTVSPSDAPPSEAPKSFGQHSHSGLNSGVNSSASSVK